jgi:predicted nucleic acid-binding protein
MEVRTHLLLAVISFVPELPPVPGAMPRDPDDDKIVACALAAGAEYIESRDRDLLSLGNYAGIAITAPEPFLRVVRGP